MSFGSYNPGVFNNIMHKAAAKFLFVNYQYVYGDWAEQDDLFSYESAQFDTMTAIMDSLQTQHPKAFDTIMTAGGDKYIDEFHADRVNGLVDATQNDPRFP
ncbi:hypothetical protein LCGC14_0919860 [marine sediment metagenome]|uniref:Uncharacterized protein n=1 Tax=marine sediment metagenome TaxID=412755 RepID=A0A0F9R9V1_9ZZZZ